MDSRLEEGEELYSDEEVKIVENREKIMEYKNRCRELSDSLKHNNIDIKDSQKR